ncbi:hypothetical protein ABZ920_00535 [Streptomyces sp. NPDC046831]|uniref:hypothetical protein n=1 Tax=Streptomyces sp. NPDC046831 TaxID=3154805 RepID=UPI0033F9AACC
MIMTRSSAITAAVAAAAALTATGITYASASAAPVPQAAPAAVHQAVAPAQAPTGGDVGGNNNNDNDNDRGGDRGNDHGGKDKDYDEGWIHINERSYNARPGGCITVVSGLGSRTLNIRNDSKKTVEVFRGVTCDNGAPIATVGPRSSSNGVRPGCTEGVRVHDGVVGSFRVIHDHRGGDKGGY